MLYRISNIAFCMNPNLMSEEGTLGTLRVVDTEMRA